MEQKLESNLEQLALLQWELEEYKLHTMEQMERLSQQKRDVESELRVKDIETKKLKLKIIALESAPMSLIQAETGRSSGFKTATANLQGSSLHQKNKRSLTSFMEEVQNSRPNSRQGREGSFKTNSEHRRYSKAETFRSNKRGEDPEQELASQSKDGEPLFDRANTYEA